MWCAAWAIRRVAETLRGFAVMSVVMTGLLALAVVDWIRGKRVDAAGLDTSGRRP